jgi:hypothetical protein
MVATESLIELATRFVALSAQLEETRNAMRIALANGVGEAPVRPTQGPRKAAGRDEVMAKAAEIEAKIVALVRERPMGTAEIAKMTASNVSSTSERLRRLRARGMVAGGRGEGWRVTQATTPA